MKGRLLSLARKEDSRGKRAPLPSSSLLPETGEKREADLFIHHYPEEGRSLRSMTIFSRGRKKERSGDVFPPAQGRDLPLLLPAY